MEGESSHINVPKEPMWDKDETLDVTTMVAHIDFLETIMHLILDQMKTMNDKKSSELPRSQELLVDKEMQKGGFKFSDASARLPMLGKARWWLKDLKPPK